jgi:hypothetical protein
MSFYDKWAEASAKNASRLWVGLAPRLTLLPEPMWRFDDPFFPFSKAIINATADLVCGYVFHLGAFLAQAGAGAVALERSLRYVPQSLPIILHGAFATPDYLLSAYEDGFNSDAVTLGLPDPALARVYSQAPHTAFLPAPAQAEGQALGVYAEGHLSLADLRGLWVSEAVIFAGGGADFQDAIRAKAEHYRKESLHDG